ncbi:MAG: sulfite exporter TauE/SafE family protein [Bacteroidota bacterium]
MILDFLTSFDLYSWQVFLILILAGFAVGIINTLAGSGSVITFSLLVALGIPAPMANGTMRLGVLMQTSTAAIRFYRKGKLDINKALKLSIPVIIGSITGAMIAVNIPHHLFEKIIGVSLLVLMVFMIFDPKKWIEEQKDKTGRKVGVLQVLLFFLVGIYGGFIHIGVGIFLLSALVLQAGYDLVKANAIKVFIVLMYSPFAIAIYVLDGQMEWVLGLIAAIGHFAGGIVGSQLAITRGAGFVRILLIVIVLGFSGHLLGVWNAIF